MLIIIKQTNFLTKRNKKIKKKILATIIYKDARMP